MELFIIVLVALWVYPILGFLLFWYTKKRMILRKRIIIISCLISAIAISFTLLNISTTSSTIDWLFFSTCYLSISLLLIWTQHLWNTALKVIGIVGMIFVFGIGYLSGTIGILGVGFIVADYETDHEKYLTKTLIYKESTLGNALSDYRDKKIEIYKTSSWLPVVEWRIYSKNYQNLLTVKTPLTADYKIEKKTIYLSGLVFSTKNNRKIVWTDSLIIK